MEVHGKTFCKKRCEYYHDEGVTIYEKDKYYFYHYEFKNFKNYQQGDNIWVWNDDKNGMRFRTIEEEVHSLKEFNEFFDNAEKRIMNKKLNKIKSL